MTPEVRERRPLARMAPPANPPTDNDDTAAHCQICGRKISSALSVLAGAGRRCAEKLAAA
jgi:hypothetical protein